MAGGDMRRERERADADRVAVVEPVVDTRGRESSDAEMPQRPEGAVTGAAGRDELGIAVADPQLRAGRLLQLAQSARVVEMRMRVEQHLDIANVEAELRDAADDQRCGLGIPAVDQDVALGPGD